MKFGKLIGTAFIALMAMTSTSVWATVVSGDTCGVPDRVATLSDAAYCAFGSGNPDGSTVASYYGNTWGNAGELITDGTNGYLTATSDIGWGTIPNSGTWEIDSSFWSVYDSAVISIHIGNGNGEPDHWAFLMNDNATSGTWSVDYIIGGTQKGGGLSNIKLWGVRKAEVPAPAALALMGLGLLGLGVVRRRKA